MKAAIGAALSSEAKPKSRKRSACKRVKSTNYEECFLKNKNKHEKGRSGSRKFWWRGDVTLNQVECQLNTKTL